MAWNHPLDSRKTHKYYALPDTLPGEAEIARDLAALDDMAVRHCFAVHELYDSLQSLRLKGFKPGDDANELIMEYTEKITKETGAPILAHHGPADGEHS